MAATPTSSRAMSQLQDLAERVERLLLRHQELQLELVDQHRRAFDQQQRRPLVGPAEPLARALHPALEEIAQVELVRADCEIRDVVRQTVFDILAVPAERIRAAGRGTVARQALSYAQIGLDIRPALVNGAASHALDFDDAPRDRPDTAADDVTDPAVPLTVTVDRQGRLKQVIPGEMAEDDVMELATWARAQAA